MEKMRGKGRDGIVVNVGAIVGMASFAASAMGFRVLEFEPVFENLQKICEGIYFNRVADLVIVFQAVASDRLGNITFHKVLFLEEVEKGEKEEEEISHMPRQRILSRRRENVTNSAHHVIC